MTSHHPIAAHANPRLPDVAAAVDANSRWLWCARRDPSALVGMFAPPEGFGFDVLSGQQIEAIVSLVGPQSYDAAPLRRYAFDLHDLYGGGDPADPRAERAELARAATQVRQLVDAGVGVAVHCHAGIGRTGTVIGAVLVSLGHSVAEVTAWLDAVQKARGAAGWPESSWQGENLDVLLTPG